ncbi:hypothetical protein ABPG74_002720 [Tetrahymena malaccensis]
MQTINYQVKDFKNQNIHESSMLISDETLINLFEAINLNAENQKNQFETIIQPKLVLLQKQLQNKTCLFAVKLSFADIYTYSAIKLFKSKFSEQYNHFAETFDNFLQIFEQIPKVQEVLSQEISKLTKIEAKIKNRGLKLSKIH